MGQLLLGNRPGNYLEAGVQRRNLLKCPKLSECVSGVWGYVGVRNTIAMTDALFGRASESFTLSVRTLTFSYIRGIPFRLTWVIVEVHVQYAVNKRA